MDKKAAHNKWLCKSGATDFGPSAVGFLTQLQ